MKYHKKNKKGISEVLGYLLLISFAVFMSTIVYQGLKTYVPEKTLECPEGVSIFVQTAKCNLSAEGVYGIGPYDLGLTIKNNGRYNIAGYFIHASDNQNQTIATISLIDNLNDNTMNAYKFGNAVIFEESTSGNFVNVSSIAFAEYTNIPQKIYSLDIVPIRFQEEKNRMRMVSCGGAVLKERITCN